MATLIKKISKIDPAASYEAVKSYTGPGGTFAAGTRLRGDHDEVRARFGRWMLAELPDDEKGKVRAQESWGRLVAEDATRATAETAPPIARPPTGRFRAVRSWTLADPDLAHRGRVNAGELVDAGDEVFRRYPHLFVADIEER